MYQFYMNDILLPQTPSSMVVQVKNQNKTINLVNGGEINLLNKAGLSKVTFTAVLPNAPYHFASYKNGFKNAQYYLDKLEGLKTSLKPFEFRVIRSDPSGSSIMGDTKLSVSLEDYKITEDAEKYGFDVAVDITLLQYQQYGTKVFVLTKNDAGKTTATQQTNRETTKATTGTYTVKAGDSLSAIARTQLGDGSRWKELYELNKTVIEEMAKKNGRASSSNGLWIYTGTVLKLSVSSKSSSSTAPQKQKPLVKKYTANDALMMAKVMFCESRGIKSKTEIACLGWTILNRVDSGQSQFKKTIAGNITAPGPQFAYNANASTRSDYGYDLVWLATDVLNRWSREKAGEQNVGRVLPRNYYWYGGDGKHNYFRTTYKLTGVYWKYSLPSPYES